MTSEEMEKAILSEIDADPEAFSEASVCTIDPNTRVITVPVSLSVFGTESDEKTNRIPFRCPRVVGDNVDLSNFQICINFRNANSEKDRYIVEDMMIDGDEITFSWSLSRKVTKYKGKVSFIVCALNAREGTIVNEWNTTLAFGTVLEGLEADEVNPDEEEKDIILQLLAMVDAKSNKALEEIEAAKNEAVKEVQSYGGVLVDQNLENEGQAADAKVTGDKIAQLRGDLSQLSEEIKNGSDIAAWVTDAGHRPVPPMISFTDDDCRSEVYSLLYPVIKKHGIPYTLALPPQAIGTEGYMTKAQIAELQSNGITFTSHHLKQYNMDKTNFPTYESYETQLDETKDAFIKLGIDAKAICYPQGKTVTEYIPCVKKYYKAGFTVDRGINDIPYNTFYLKRCEVFPTSGAFTLNDAKALVDDVVNNGGWLIFMTHAWYETFDADGLNELIEYIISKSKSEVAITPTYYTSTYIKPSGSISDSTDANRIVTDKIDVSEGEVYKISASAVYAGLLYAIYDSDGNKVDGLASENTSSGTVVTDQFVTIPSGASSMRVSSNLTIQPNGFKVSKIVKLDTVEIVDVYYALERTGNLLEFGEITGDYKDLSSPFLCTDGNGITHTNSLKVYEMSTIKYEIISPVYYAGMHINPSGGIATSTDENREITEAISVSAGETYKVSASAIYGKLVYAVYDSAGALIDSLPSDNSVTGTVIEDTILAMPSGASALRLSSVLSIQPTGFNICKRTKGGDAKGGLSFIDKDGNETMLTVADVKKLLTLI